MVFFPSIVNIKVGEKLTEITENSPRFRHTFVFHPIKTVSFVISKFFNFLTVQCRIFRWSSKTFIFITLIAVRIRSNFFLKILKIFRHSFELSDHLLNYLLDFLSSFHALFKIYDFFHELSDVLDRLSILVFHIVLGHLIGDGIRNIDVLYFFEFKTIHNFAIRTLGATFFHTKRSSWSM